MDKLNLGLSGREQRRSRRFRRELVVEIHEKNRCQKVRAADVARHGLFLITDLPLHERHLVQLVIHLPRGTIKAAASVTRTLRNTSGAEGVGVQFFALSGEAKRRWDTFIFDLHRSQRDEPDGVLSGPARPSPSSSTPPGAPLVSGPSSPSPGLPSTAWWPSEDADQIATFIIRLKSLSRLEEFAASHLAEGGMVLYTPVLHRPGDAVKLVYVHPRTEEEFHIPGIVDAAYADRPKRLDIHFQNITPDVIERFLAYVRTGRPPAKQLRAEPTVVPQGAPGEARGLAPSGDIDFDVEIFDETVDIEDAMVFDPDPDEALAHGAADPVRASLSSSSSSSWVSSASSGSPLLDMGLAPSTFVLRCSQDGDRCSAPSYVVELGPCRGALGLVADLEAFIGNPTERVVSVPRLAARAIRRTRLEAFLEAGGTLDALSDARTLLEVASLAEVPMDPDSGRHAKETRSVKRLDALARKLAVEESAETRVHCPSCAGGRLVVTRAS